MEVEAWIMADRRAFAAFMRVPLDSIPEIPDVVPRPRELIVSLARRSSRRDIREDLVPSPGSTAIIGPAFNARLAEFVATAWNPGSASSASPSLHRAMERLRDAFR